MTVLRGVLSPPAARPYSYVRVRGRELVLGRRTGVMGVVNVTPDSFSDGGNFLDAGRAVDLGLEMERCGAEIIDIGGESTRPGASPVTAGTGTGAHRAVVTGLRQKSDVLISVDTTKAAVAPVGSSATASRSSTMSPPSRAIRTWPDSLPNRGRAWFSCIGEATLRRCRRIRAIGTLWLKCTSFSKRAVAAAEAAGVAPDSILVDPGFGFGKTVDHNLVLLNRLGVLSSLGKPILVGTSRKSFIGRLLDVPDRGEASRHVGFGCGCHPARRPRGAGCTTCRK